MFHFVVSKLCDEQKVQPILLMIIGYAMQILFYDLIGIFICPSLKGWEVDDNFIFTSKVQKTIFRIYIQIQVHNKKMIFLRRA
jgi:hypothetical protein